MDAISHEELYQILLPSVFHQQITWEAKPIIDVFQIVDMDLDIAKGNSEV